MREAPLGCGPRLADGIVLAALAFGGYCLLWQTTLYESDGHAILRRFMAGEIIHNNHYLYMPMLMGLAQLLAPLHPSPRTLAMLLSSLGTAAGVGLTHACARPLGLGRLQAVLMTLLVAVAPPVVFFATVVEFHGPFFAFSQLAFLAAVRMVRRRTVASAVGVGLASTLAFSAHSSGLLLPGLLVPWYLGCRLDARSGIVRRDLGLLLVAGLAMAASFVALLWLLHQLGFPEFPPSYDRGRLLGSWDTVGQAPWMVWQEWGRPYMPLSVAALLCCLPRAVRYRGLALVCGQLSFLFLCLVLLIDRPGRGEYLLPVVAPAAFLVVTVWRRPLVIVLILATAGFAGRMLAEHDIHGPRYRLYTAGVHRAAGDRKPFLLVAEEIELGAILVCMPDVPYYVITELGVQSHDVAGQLPSMLGWFVRKQTDAGYDVLLSRHAEDYVTRYTALGREVMKALRESCVLEPVDNAGFHGYRVRPR